MPELPEVETVVRTLENVISRATISDVIVYTSSIVYHRDNFVQSCVNQTFTSFLRKGKYIILGLNSLFLIVHLRMEGRFFINYDRARPNKHVHVSFMLSDGRVLHYQDTRKFGRMLITNDINQTLHHLGLEYDDPLFTVAYLYDAMQKSSRSLKAFLLSQHIITGLGNIYVDEVCFRSKIHPMTSCNKLSLMHVKQIHQSILHVLDEAIMHGGSSIRTYTNAMGIDGRFQLHLQVHMRAGQPCIECQQPIEKISIAQRGTYVCHHCQKVLK